MPMLLDGRIDHYKNQYDQIASGMDSSHDVTLILGTTNNGNTSPAVGDFDFSQPVHADDFFCLITLRVLLRKRMIKIKRMRLIVLSVTS